MFMHTIQNCHEKRIIVLVLRGYDSEQLRAPFMVNNKMILNFIKCSLHTQPHGKIIRDGWNNI